jgi:hypothetical protein
MPLKENLSKIDLKYQELHEVYELKMKKKIRKL